ncbi:MAG: hypothetical protein EBT84_10175 [Sphingomonadaceae bacterium]|nr:hypothetical protein [Sphingomonadaceae bacterium]
MRNELKGEIAASMVDQRHHGRDHGGDQPDGDHLARVEPADGESDDWGEVHVPTADHASGNGIDEEREAQHQCGTSTNGDAQRIN